MLNFDAWLSYKLVGAYIIAIVFAVIGTTLVLSLFLIRLKCVRLFLESSYKLSVIVDILDALRVLPKEQMVQVVIIYTLSVVFLVVHSCGLL